MLIIIIRCTRFGLRATDVVRPQNFLRWSGWIIPLDCAHRSARIWFRSDSGKHSLYLIKTCMRAPSVSARGAAVAYRKGGGGGRNVPRKEKKKINTQTFVAISVGASQTGWSCKFFFPATTFRWNKFTTGDPGQRGKFFFYKVAS